MVGRNFSCRNKLQISLVLLVFVSEGPGVHSEQLDHSRCILYTIKPQNELGSPRFTHFVSCGMTLGSSNFLSEDVFIRKQILVKQPQRNNFPEQMFWSGQVQVTIAKLESLQDGL